MKLFAVYLLLKYLQRTVKFFCKNCPHLCFFSKWGAYDQIFKKFAKMHERKVAYIGVSNSNFN